MAIETAREEVLRLWNGAREEQRRLWIPTWRDIVNFVIPERGKYLDRQIPNDGRVYGEDILNTVASRSLRTLASGMMSSLTNPARPWFRITTADPTLAELGSVRAYLFQIERLIQWVFARSNIHNELHISYRDLGSIGTCPLHIDEDDDDVIRAYVYPVGQYAAMTNARQRVDSIGREFSYTVRQVVQRFGLDAVSKRVRRQYEKGELNQAVKVLHLIQPNEDFRIGAFGVKGMRWRSVWMEMSVEDKRESGILRVGGYRQFPTAVSRWETTGTEDVYGHSPVRDVLPEIKQLQHLEDRKITLIDKALTPPTQGPPGVDFPSLLAGAHTQLPTGVAAGAEVRPIYQPDYRAIQESRISVQELEMRIRIGLHEDLWRLLVDRDAEGRPPQMTAYEVSARHEEKLTLLGPVVDRIHNELLSPLIRRTTSILSDRGLLPPPPRELAQAIAQGEDVRIEYMSVLAQAQRLLGLGAMERFASIALTLAGNDPLSPVWDKIDRDEIIDQAADMLGIPPSVVRSDGDVAEMRISRARQQRAAQDAQVARTAAETTRTLSQSPVGQDSALTRLLAQYGPVAESTVGGQA